jgi:hypothetical protein
MANYWAIFIGINQYHLFQPLHCAQADAEVLKDFLVQEAGFPPQNCLLMTDNSPPLKDQSTYPTKENILLLLEDLAAKSWRPQDHLWLFFSGYGINYKDNDYLMPVEANPDLVQETGIEVRSLMQSLQLADLNVLLIFDINRAFGTQADAPVGQETVELAQELQLATILSCQPEQFSHESRELGHGFFTTALLTALRAGYGSSLTELASHVSVLTPELCQHHWRPPQNPVIVIPSPQYAILPSLSGDGGTSAKSEAAPPVIFPGESFAVALAAPSLEANSSPVVAQVPQNGKQETTIKPGNEEQKKPKSPLGNEKTQYQPASPPTSPPKYNLQPPPQMLPPASEMAGGGRYIPNALPTDVSQSRHSTANNSFWQMLLWWIGGFMLIGGVITVVFLRNQARFKNQEILKTPPDTSNNTGQTVIPSLPNNASVANSPVPIPTKKPSRPPVKPNSQSQKRNQAVLDLAKMSLRQTQASDLSLAIATAQKIKPGEPLYQQAQENIQIWSRMILDLAEGRAQQRQYTNAIAAAQLITKDAELYPQAQASINQWRLEAKQYLSNKTLLDAANALIKPEQASTYNRAIEVAKRVPPGQPGFDMAQKSINKWSEKILELAKTRASQGDLNAAIETATLIPEVTSVYEDAQAAIEKWQARRMRK